MFLSFLFCANYMLANVALAKEYNGYERPDWVPADVQPKDKSYEVRHYFAANWTCTDITGAQLSSDRKAAFWRLFGFIQGSNSAGTTMAMTVPVTTKITIGPTLFDTRKTMAFYIPSKFQENPPSPTNPLLHVENRLPMTVYVRTFSGYADETDWWRNLNLLYLDLVKNGVDMSKLDLKSFYTAGYDSPFRLINRRNEVWLAAISK